MSQTDLDDLAARLWKADAEDCGAPVSVAAGRTRDEFDAQHDATKDRWRKFARVSVAELASLRVELEQVKAERDEDAHISRMLLSWAADHGEEPDLLLRDWQHSVKCAEEAEAELRQLRREAVETMKPFSYFAAQVDEWRHDDDSTCLRRVYARHLRAARAFVEKHQ